MQFPLKSAAALMAVLLPTAASAHPAIFHDVSSFSAGVLHPLMGFDHLLAMMTVGLLASQKGGRAFWLWPAAFVSAMVIGGLLGMNGVSAPLIEPAIAASLLVLGLLVATMARLPITLGLAVIAVFGLFHGNAHGLEAPVSGTALLYAAGFVLATASLHVAGLCAGLCAQRIQIQPLLRAGALMVSATGAFMLLA